MNWEILNIFKALSDPTRFQIVEYLTKEDLTTAELMEKLQMSQPTIFRHLQKLKQAGIVEVCSTVNPARYRLCYPGLDLTLQQLLAGDPEGKTLEQLRREQELQRQEQELQQYLKSHRTDDGRWIYERSDLYSPYVLQEILNLLEQNRPYAYRELRMLLDRHCQSSWDLLTDLKFQGYLRKEQKMIDYKKRGMRMEEFYYRTEKKIQLPL